MINKKGMIICSISGEFKVLSGEDEYICKPLGIMRYQKISPKVGDIVDIESKDGNVFTITKIEERKNDFIRPVVSNITKTFIVTSLTRPDLNLNLLDRLLCQIEWYDIPIVLVFTKADLVDIENFNSIITYYEKLGYKTYIAPNDIDLIKKEIDNNICVLAGQSGVGKSRLVNSLDSRYNLKTDDISVALGRGKHTTRHVELLRVGNGFIADTPGFGTLDLEMDSVSLSHTFREFFDTKCKFNPCFHVNEPSCNVLKKVLNNEILKSRYDNYLLFLKEIRERESKKY